MKSFKNKNISTIIWSNKAAFLERLINTDNKFLLNLIEEKISEIVGKIIKISSKQIFLQRKAIQVQPEKWEVQVRLEKRVRSVPRVTKEARELEELRVYNQITFIILKPATGCRFCTKVYMNA